MDVGTLILLNLLSLPLIKEAEGLEKMNAPGGGRSR
jgi:hypothetical protein